MRTSAPGTIGPNAVIQTGVALHAFAGVELQHEVFRKAKLDGYLKSPPSQMVPEGEVTDLFAALQGSLPLHQANAVLEEAGRRTADYIIAHRIPRVAASLIALSPRAVAARLLLAAIGRHAWTFAGSGTAQVQLGRAMALEIFANPLATVGCSWHVAILRRLYARLVSPLYDVVQTGCCAAGNPACRFRIGPRPRMTFATQDGTSRHADPHVEARWPAHHPLCGAPVRRAEPNG